jgi:hypothetical protein
MRATVNAPTLFASHEGPPRRLTLLQDHRLFAALGAGAVGPLFEDTDRPSSFEPSGFSAVADVCVRATAVASKVSRRRTECSPPR